MEWFEVLGPAVVIALLVRLEALLLNMPPAKRERVLEEVAFAEPTFASLVRGQLPRVARRVPRSGPTRQRVARA